MLSPIEKTFLTLRPPLAPVSSQSHISGPNSMSFTSNSPKARVAMARKNPLRRAAGKAITMPTAAQITPRMTMAARYGTPSSYSSVVP